jgi:hypothetical protein
METKMANEIIIMKNFCRKCDAFRIICKYKSGMTQKVVYSIQGKKCHHSWNINMFEIMDFLSKIQTQFKQ